MYIEIMKITPSVVSRQLKTTSVKEMDSSMKRPTVKSKNNSKITNYYHAVDLCKVGAPIF